MKKQVLDELKDGATLNPANMKKVIFPAGYMVGVTNNEVKPENIRAELVRVASFARRVKNAFVGVWYESSADVWFVDISIFVADKVKAIRMGSTFQQQAVFEWSTMDCIYLDTVAADVAEN